jgi:DNA mismatch repair protein MutL
LPTHVVNQIAAGEVVDRPASVVKELIENAIDAGSTQVDVEIVAGGRKLIAVGDNGSGMSRDDAILSVERHATSKLGTVDDIEHIATLGFRGEALAAIASVARVRMVSSPAGSAAGTEIVIVGGGIQEVRETGAPGGTRIEVRDLFFNVPARRKFLRSYPTEMGHVRACFMTLAMARPTVGMSLTVDGRRTYRLPPGGTLDDRIRELFGVEFFNTLRPVRQEGGEVAVTGMVSGPDVHRSDRAEQYFFINGRATTAAILNHAVREAYRAVVPDSRHPCVFLHLSMAPDLVDVNVHPAKREVRFRHPAAVRDALADAVRRSVGLPAMPLPVASAPAVDAGGEVPRAHVQLPIENLAPLHTFRYPRMGTAAAAPDATDGMGPAPGPGAGRADATAVPARAGAATAPAGSAQTAPW